MLMGTYQHNIDKKGRVFIPAKMRKDLGENFVITLSIQKDKKCLCVFSENYFDKFAKTISAKVGMKAARDYIRSICPTGDDSNCDAQGRVMIPQALREFAEISETAVIIGMYDSAEIWSPENYEAEKKRINETQNVDFLETLTISID